jgi:23S rRNA pseudouridine1911/1915/1917 synthase
VDTAFKPILQPRIVYDEGGVIVVAKPSGMHCAPAGEAGTLCSWLFRLRPELALVRGRASEGGRDTGEGGLLHRLDAATSGLVAFAANDMSFSLLLDAGKAGTFVKSYRALGIPSVSGLLGSRPITMTPPGVDQSLWISCLRRADADRISELLPGRSIVSVFRPYGPGATRVACAQSAGQGSSNDPAVVDGKNHKAWTRDSYRTEILTARPFSGGVLVEVALARGFRHQVRAHLAWLGLPLDGDPTYGDGPSRDSGSAAELRLRAWRLSFPSPGGTGNVVVDLDELERDAC